MSLICPICENNEGKIDFPFKTLWNKKIFNYYLCKICKSTYINPIPNQKDFQKMYSIENYHEVFYSEINNIEYSKSINLLKKKVKRKKTLLDFGCGKGFFLLEAKKAGDMATGVEINLQIINNAKKISGCPVYTFQTLLKRKIKFDIIHLCDVLEHCSDPFRLMNQLTKILKNDGIFFIEGPLENNPSPVYLFSYIYGWIKKIFFKSILSNDPPTHIFRVNALSQKYFFVNRLKFKEKYFKIYENGWPYYSNYNNNILKKMIGILAILIGGIKIGKIVFGNRVYSIYKP